MTANAEHTRLAVGCEDGLVRVFDVADQKLEYIRSYEPQQGRIMSLAWWKNIVVAGGTDSFIRKFDTKTGKMVGKMMVERIKGIVERKKGMAKSRKPETDTIVWDLTVMP